MKFANALDKAIERQEVESDPSDKQKESGNYRKAHIRLHGMDISIENPKGYTRSGVSKDGKRWSNKLAHHYGYIKGTEGPDKDHIDVFIGPKPASRKVFIVNQCDPGTKKFDEHKVMLGFDDEEAAEAGYFANYEKGWQGLASIHEIDVDMFKLWLKVGNTKQEYDPFWMAAVDKTASFVTGYQEVMEKAASIEVGRQTFTEIPIVSDKAEFQSILQPGDILLFKPSGQADRNGSIVQNFLSGTGVWGNIKKMFNQGSDWGHSGIYAGDGKIIHSYPNQKGKAAHDPKQSKVRYHSVGFMMDNLKRDILVLRPNTSEQERRQAVERARTLIGKPYSIKDMILAGLAPSLVKGDLAESPGTICSAVVSYAYPGIYFRGHQSDRVVRPSDLHRNENVTELEGYSMDAKTASEHLRGYLELYGDFIKLAWQFAEGAEDMLKSGRTPEEWEAFKKSFENPSVREKFNKRYAGSQNSAGRVFQKVLLEDNESASSAFGGTSSSQRGSSWRKYQDEYDNIKRKAQEDQARWEAERQKAQDGFARRQRARDKAWNDFAKRRGYKDWADYEEKVNQRWHRTKRPGGGGSKASAKKGSGSKSTVIAGLSVAALATLWALHQDKQRRERQAAPKAASLSFIIGYNEVRKRMEASDEYI